MHGHLAMHRVPGNPFREQSFLIAAIETITDHSNLFHYRGES